MVVFQLFVYPRVIRRVGVVTWQRAGGLLGVPFFVAVPYARSLSWNERSLFVVSVANNVLAVFSIGSVRRQSIKSGLLPLFLSSAPPSLPPPS